MPTIDGYHCIDASLPLIIALPTLGLTRTSSETCNIGPTSKNSGNTERTNILILCKHNGGSGSMIKYQVIVAALLTGLRVLLQCKYLPVLCLYSEYRNEIFYLF